MAVTSFFDDFNRADGSLGPNWTNQCYSMEISNMKAQAGDEWPCWCAATYNGGTGNVLEGDIQANADYDRAQFIGFLMNYRDNSNTLLIKVQGSYGAPFNRCDCYYGFYDINDPFNYPILEESFWFHSDPFTTAHMKVELIGSTAYITFSNIDGGSETREYTWYNVPSTGGGTGVGIAGYKTPSSVATMDNFSVTTSKAPPGWDNGKKSGWDNSVPPGLDKEEQTPPGFDQGGKTGWN